ncbi:DUF4364 family protein [Mahella australiensis]|uniref:DUF4364 domain-containing protein n=1 Tax=Mahella australiensis (strain DSM 15567 / CIP 107919 / 50-1 BON) TaxID=697281 RepID=F3ZY91_MAHA5|nr:DUF4364 family protein [Mahella australiensis]AEE95616.1 hypothetical protein Mahau_0400 [Mahella australiensis 50-1 BON]
MYINESQADVNRLAILYFIDKMHIPIPNAQITHFMVGANVMNYFDLQQLLSQLVRDGLVDYMESQGRYFYSINDKGKSIVVRLYDDIPQWMVNLIDDYAKGKHIDLPGESEMPAFYEKKNEEEYIVHCKVIENGMMLMDLRINVPNSELAQIICDGWPAKAADVYKAVVENISS